MKPVVVSFYGSNTDPRAVEYQGRVVDRFRGEIPFSQVKSDARHGANLDGFVRGSGADLFVILDSDCIPLNADAITYLVDRASKGFLIGCAQRANHIENGRHVYVSPFCMALNAETYRRLGSPSFAETARGDVGEELTYRAEAAGVQTEMLWPTHCGKPMWDLTGGRRFGIGTTYERGVYHQFFARSGDGADFIRKCMGVLGELEGDITILTASLGRPSLADLARCVAAQACRCRWLIVFDGSDSAAAGAPHVPGDPRVRTYTTHEGPPRGPNTHDVLFRALDRVETKYVCFMDDDNRCHPDHVSILLKALESGARFAATRRLYCDGAMEPVGREAELSELADTNCSAMETQLLRDAKRFAEENWPHKTPFYDRNVQAYLYARGIPARVVGAYTVLYRAARPDVYRGKVMYEPMTSWSILQVGTWRREDGAPPLVPAPEPKAAAPEPPAAKRERTSMGKDMIIVTAAVGARYPQQVKDDWVKNLRGTGYAGDIDILNWAQPYTPPAVQEMMRGWPYFFDTERVLAYLNKMKAIAGAGYKTVMTIDLRDSIFQGNPERIGHSGLDFFLEDPTVRIGKCPWNGAWTRDGWGQEGIDRIGGEVISCSGTVIGTPERMLDYYTRMWGLVLSGKACVRDQGIHNWIIYAEKIDARLVCNEEGDVYTVGGMREIRVSHHKILNKAGLAPCVVHQADRQLVKL